MVFSLIKTKIGLCTKADKWNLTAQIRTDFLLQKHSKCEARFRGQGRDKIGSMGFDGVFVQLANRNRAGSHGALPALVGKRRSKARHLCSAQAGASPLHALTGKQ